MDRTISYPGAIPLIENFSQAQQQAYIAAMMAIDAVMGVGATVATGFGVTTSSSSLGVTIGVGSVTAGPTLVDPSGFGNIRATQVSAAAQYLSTAPTSLTLIAGSTNYIYATPSTVNDGSVVLPYYNASNPAQTFAGPGNNGTSQPTLAQCVATVAVTTGSVPAGSYLLYTVVVPANTTATTGLSFTPSSILLSLRLPGVPAAIAACLAAAETYANGTSSATQNGWFRHPGGIIDQWGGYETASNGAVQVTFPIAFPNSCFNVTLCEAHAGGAWASNDVTVHGVDNAPSTTGFQADVRIWNGSGWVAAAAAGYWRATGF